MDDKQRPFDRGLLANIVEYSEDAIVSKDLDGIITSWNEGAERIFGYHAEEVIGRPVTILIPPDRIDEEPGILQRIRHGERVEPYHTIRRRKDGSFVDVSLQVSPIRDENGKVIGASKIARDISEQQRAQERLRRSEERFRVTLASIGDGVIATDTNGRVTFMNAVAEKLTGWCQQDTLGVPLEETFRILSEIDRTPVENPVKRVLRDGNIVGLGNHTILVAKDGTERPIDDSAAPVRDTSGEIVGVVLVFRDAGQKRDAQMAAMKLAAIVENSEEAIISKDLTGRITSWNRGAERIFGYTSTEALGQPVPFTPEERHEEERSVLERIKSGEKVEHFESARIAKDGRKIDVLMSVSAVRNPSTGQIIGASKIMQDISARKKAERELAETRRQLEQHAQKLESEVAKRTQQLRETVAELEAFCYSLSHDMRAPVRAIQSYTEMVLAQDREKLASDSLEYLQKVVSAAERMDQLIQDVLAFTRLSRQEITLVPVNVDKLVRDIIAERPELQSARAEIRVESPLMQVRGHAASLTQCITNLLDNAVKFVPKGIKPQVCVRTEGRNGKVRLEVEDKGIGIAEDAQRRLFEMFQRIHTGEEYEGTGIGLAIVRRAAERMGGSVGLHSEVGRGSQFWVELPGVGA
jgi:PAS domain S-box-containing protein